MNREADPALSMRAEAIPPAATERDSNEMPVWMETSAPPEPRRGASPARTSPLHTLLFFGLIAAVVGAAGALGIALWGPEKPIKSRTQLATNPPPPQTLPSFPPEAAEVTAAEVATAEVTLPPVASTSDASAPDAKPVSEASISKKKTSPTKKSRKAPRSKR